MAEFVYSTDSAWCSKCKKLPCGCSSGKPAKPSKPGAWAKMRLEKNGRGGKAVTVLFELGMAEPVLKELLKTLKTRCGTGGAVKGDTLEIQGDQREKIEQVFAERGLRLKRAGG